PRRSPRLRVPRSSRDRFVSPAHVLLAASRHHYDIISASVKTATRHRSQEPPGKGMDKGKKGYRGDESRSRRLRAAQDWRSVAPVEIARAPCPECRVERGAFDVLDRLLAWPGKSLGAQLGGRLAVERLLDPGLLLALEQRMVLERIAGQVRV